MSCDLAGSLPLSAPVCLALPDVSRRDYDGWGLGVRNSRTAGSHKHTRHLRHKDDYLRFARTREQSSCVTHARCEASAGQAAGWRASFLPRAGPSALGSLRPHAADHGSQQLIGSGGGNSALAYRSGGGNSEPQRLTGASAAAGRSM